MPLCSEAGAKCQMELPNVEVWRMSVSLYRWTEECDRRECPGDCDMCHENEEDEDEHNANKDAAKTAKASD